MSTETIGILLDTDYNGKGVQEAAKDVDRVANQFSKIGGAIDSAGSRLGGLGSSVKGVFGGITGTISGAIETVGQFGRNLAGIQEVGRLVGAGISALTSSGREFELFEGQLSVFLGSTDAAKERLKELAEFGASTPFELPQLVEAEKALLSYIGTEEKALEVTGQSFGGLRAIIGDTAASVGVDFGELTNIVGKFSTGATGEAIARLQELGIATKDQLREVGIQFDKGGALTSPIDEALTATIKIMEERFGGGSEKLAATFEGQISTMKDSFEALKRGVTQPVFEVFKAGLASALPALGELANRATAFGEEFSGNFRDSLVEFQDDGFGPVQAALGALGDALSDTVPAAKPLGDALVTLSAFAERAVEAFGEGGLQGVLANLPDIFADLGIDPAIGDSIINLFKAIQDAFGSLTSSAAGFDGGKLLSGIIDGIAGALPTIIDFTASVVKLVGFLVDNKEAILEFAKGFLILKTLVTITQPVLGLSAAIGGLAGPLATLAKGAGPIAKLAGVLGPKLAAFASLLGGPVTVAIAAVGAAILAYKTNFLGFGDAVDKVVGFVKNLFSGLSDFKLPDIGGALSEFGAKIASFFEGFDLTDAVLLLLAPVFAIPNLISEKLTGEGLIDHFKSLFGGIDLEDAILLILAPVFGIPNLIIEKLTGEGIAEHIKGLFSGIDIEPPAFLSNLFGGGEADQQAEILKSQLAEVQGTLQSLGTNAVGAASQLNKLGLPDEAASAFADLGASIADLSPDEAVTRVNKLRQALADTKLPPEAASSADALLSAMGDVALKAGIASEQISGIGAEPPDVSFIDSISTKLGEVDISGALSAIGSKFANLGDFISFDVGKLANIFDPAALGETVNSFFSTAATSGDWSSSFGETIGTSLEESLTGIGVYLDGGAVADTIDGFFSSLSIDTTALDGLVTGIGEKFVGAQQAVSDALAPIRDAVDTGFAEAQGVVDSVQDSIRAKVQEVWNAIPADIREDLVVIASILETKFQEQVDKINEKLESAKAAVDEKLEEIKTFFSEKFAAARDIVETELEAARKFVDDKISEAREIFDRELGEIQETTERVFGEVKKAIADAVADFKSKFIKPFEDAAASVSEAVGRIQAVVSAKFQEIRASIDERLEEAKATVRQRFNEAVESAKAALEPIVDRVREPFDRAVQAIVDVLQTLRDKIVNPIRDALASIPSAISSAIANVEQIGTDIVTGIARGISAAGQKLKDAALGVVRDAVSGLRKFLESFSPSRLTGRVVGIPFGEGIAVGILATGLAISSAATSVVSAAVDAAQSVVPFQGIDLFLVDENAERAALEDALDKIEDAKTKLKGLEDLADKAEAQVGRATASIQQALAAFFASGNKDGLEGLLEQLAELGAEIDDGFFIEAGILDAKSFDDVRRQIEDLAGEPDKQRKLWDALIDGLSNRWGVFYDENLSALEKLANEQKKLIAEAKKGGGENVAAEERLEGINEQIASLKEQNDLVRSIIDQQTFSVENQFKLYDRLAAIVKDRAADEAEAARALEELQRKIADAIKERQELAEDAEDRAFDQTLALIDAEERRRDEAHKIALAQLEIELQAARDRIEEETKLNEDFHKSEIERIRQRENAIQDEIDANDRRIDILKTAQAAIESGQELTQEERDLLAELGIDPNEVAAATVELEKAKAVVDQIDEILKGLPKDDRARAKVTDSAQQAALQGVLATAENLSKSDRRILEVAAAGREVNTKRLREILERAQKQAEDTIDSQEQQAKKNPIDEEIEKIGLASDRKKRALEDEKKANEALLALEDERFRKEQERISTLTADIEARIEAENKRYDDEKANLANIREIERLRHEERMRQIEEEYALQLLRLGKTEEEVLKALEEQRARAKAISEEAARRFQELLGSTITLPPPVLPEPPPAAEDPANPNPADVPPPVQRAPAPPGQPIEPPPIPPPPIDQAALEDAVQAASEGLSDTVADTIGAGVEEAARDGLLDGILGALSRATGSTALEQQSLEFARSFASPTEIALDALIAKATTLRNVLSGVAGLGPVGGDITVNRNTIFNGPVTIDSGVAEELGLFDVSRVP